MVMQGKGALQFLLLEGTQKLLNSWTQTLQKAQWSDIYGL